jgi:hypothetical protein
MQKHLQSIARFTFYNWININHYNFLERLLVYPFKHFIALFTLLISVWQTWRDEFFQWTHHWFLIFAVSDSVLFWGRATKSPCPSTHRVPTQSRRLDWFQPFSRPSVLSHSWCQEIKNLDKIKEEMPRFILDIFETCKSDDGIIFVVILRLDNFNPKPKGQSYTSFYNFTNLS